MTKAKKPKAPEAPAPKEATVEAPAEPKKARGRPAKAKTALVTGFNDVCGDTFCESDYSDMQSLAFVCSITKSTGNVKACDWIFGGSFSQIATNGAVTPTSQTWTCPVPVHGTLSQLITTLTASGSTDPIDRALPGTTASAYDAIGGCLP